MNILSCNLENVYLNAQCHEKIWFEDGLECGEDVGKVCIIFVKVSMLLQYQANPRIGHIKAAYHIFAYLKWHLDRGHIAYDPTTPPVDENVFNNNADWTDFYGEVEEELPANMPKPCGNLVTISAFVDTNHAGNVVTHRLHRNSHFCSECTYHLVFKETEYSQECYIWEQISCDENCQGSYCWFVVQVTYVQSTYQRTGECIL